MEVSIDEDRLVSSASDKDDSKPKPLNVSEFTSTYMASPSPTMIE